MLSQLPQLMHGNLFIVTCTQLSTAFIHLPDLVVHAGFETARALALRGSEAIVTARDLAKATAAAAALAEQLGTQLPGGAEAAGKLLTPMALDLGSLASVRDFAAQFLATGKPLNVLMNNGVGAQAHGCWVDACAEGFPTHAHVGSQLWPIYLEVIHLYSSRNLSQTQLMQSWVMLHSCSVAPFLRLTI